MYIFQSGKSTDIAIYFSYRATYCCTTSITIAHIPYPLRPPPHAPSIGGAITTDNLHTYVDRNAPLY